MLFPQGRFFSYATYRERSRRFNGKILPVKRTAKGSKDFMRALFIDHYDSFSFNIIDMLERIGEFPVDHCYFDQLGEFQSGSGFEDVSYVVLSPGPGKPEEMTQTVELIKRLNGKKPIFAVCLGFQILMQLHGYRVQKILPFQHGALKKIEIFSSHEMYKGVSTPFEAVAYNSLGVKLGGTENAKVNITATSKIQNSADLTEEEYVESAIFPSENNVPIWGVQFHPESYLTLQGEKIFQNFLKAAFQQKVANK